MKSGVAKIGGMIVRLFTLFWAGLFWMFAALVGLIILFITIAFILHYVFGESALFNAVMSV